jgi:hypothetical protein
MNGDRCAYISNVLCLKHSTVGGGCFAHGKSSLAASDACADVRRSAPEETAWGSLISGQRIIMICHGEGDHDEKDANYVLRYDA